MVATFENLKNMLGGIMQQQQEQQKSITTEIMDKQREVNESMMVKIVEAMQTAGNQTNKATVEAAATAMKEAVTSTKENSQKENKYHAKQSENRIEHKLFSRIEKFSGGESDYKEWKFDIEITVESVCPGFKAILNEFMKDPQEEEINYDQYNLEHAKIRSK